MSAFDARIVQKTILEEIKLNGAPLGVSMTPEENENLRQIAEGSKIKDAVKCLAAAVPGLGWGFALGVTAYVSARGAAMTASFDAETLFAASLIGCGMGIHKALTDYAAALRKAARCREEARALLALGYRPVRGAAYLGLKDLCTVEINQRPEKESFEKLARGHAFAHLNR